jgi:hypothetical protein
MNMSSNVAFANAWLITATILFSTGHWIGGIFACGMTLFITMQ